MAGKCVVVQAGESTVFVDGVARAPGISSVTAGAERLCFQLSTLPPGAIGKAHLHADHESALYVLEGETVLWFGDQLEDRIEARTGDFVYVPANTPHLPMNASTTEPIVLLVARTDPNEQESMTLLPHLDGLPHVVRP